MFRMSDSESDLTFGSVRDLWKDSVFQQLHLLLEVTGKESVAVPRGSCILSTI